jgi:septation ring formation regulator EzrA
MEYTPHHEEEFKINYPRRADDLLEYNRSLLAQCEIDSLRSEVLNLRLERDNLRAMFPDCEWVSYEDHRKELEKAERECDELRSIVEQRLVAGAAIHQNANDLMRANQRLESERDELLGVIKSLRKNAKEDADRIERLEQKLFFGSDEMS